MQPEEPDRGGQHQGEDAAPAIGDTCQDHDQASDGEQRDGQGKPADRLEQERRPDQVDMPVADQPQMQVDDRRDGNHARAEHEAGNRRRPRRRGRRARHRPKQQPKQPRGSLPTCRSRRHHRDRRCCPRHGRHHCSAGWCTSP